MSRSAYVKKFVAFSLLTNRRRIVSDIELTHSLAARAARGAFPCDLGTSLESAVRASQSVIEGSTLFDIGEGRDNVVYDYDVLASAEDRAMQGSFSIAGPSAFMFHPLTEGGVGLAGLKSACASVLRGRAKINRRAAGQMLRFLSSVVR